MTCGYWLRLSGQWVPLEGVQAGVGYGIERPSSATTTVGGVRRIQSARRATRDWTLDFGQATPDAVTALKIAASGDATDVQLWDESIARENLLDPLPLAARPGYPVIDCGGMPLVSLTAGEEAAHTSAEVALKAQATLREGDGSLVWDWLTLSPGEMEALVKVTVPPTPAGMDLVAAELVLSGGEANGGTVRAHAASNAWAEAGGAPYWSTVPAGALLGSAPAAPVTTIPLGDVSAHVGTDLSLRLSLEGGTSVLFFEGRYFPDAPVVRLTYAVLAEDRVFDQHLRPGSYTLACWTDAPEGTEFGKLTVDVGGGPVDLPLSATAGTGLRYIAAPVTVPAMVDVTFTIWDSPDYVLGGLMLSTVAHPDVYMHPGKTPVRVSVDDPSLTLDMLLPGQQGLGQRGVVMREVGI